MARALLILDSKAKREKAIDWIRRLPDFTRVEFKKPRRTLPQNDAMWALLTEVAEQKRWHGVRLSTDDWKCIFLDALNKELRIVPNLDGDGFVNLGNRSSELSVEEMSNLIELIKAWGAQNGVTFHEPQQAGQAA